MTFILKFLRINDMIASSLGILSNLFLIFLIFTVNKQNLKQMSYTLLQNCYLDLFLAVVTLVAEPQIVVVNGIYYNIVGSYFHSFGYVFSTMAIATYGTSLTLSVIAMPVPFYIRYLVLCKDTVVTKILILKVYGLIIFATMILYCACIVCCWPFPGTYEMYSPALKTQFWLDEYTDGPKFCAIHPGNIRLITVFTLMCASSMISYFLIIFFSYKITSHLARSHIHMSKKTKQLNKQLLKTLAVQAIGPLVTGNFPMCCTIILIFFQYENHYITLGLSCMLGWVAVINPVAATIIIAPYRKRVQELIRIKKEGATNSTSKFDTPATRAGQPSTLFKIPTATVNPIPESTVT